MRGMPQIVARDDDLSIRNAHLPAWQSYMHGAVKLLAINTGSSSVRLALVAGDGGVLRLLAENHDDGQDQPEHVLRDFLGSARADAGQIGGRAHDALRPGALGRLQHRGGGRGDGERARDPGRGGGRVEGGQHLPFEDHAGCDCAQHQRDEARQREAGGTFAG